MTVNWGDPNWGNAEDHDVVHRSESGSWGDKDEADQEEAS